MAAVNTPIDTNGLSDLADLAYADCVRWFGPPVDPEKGFYAFYGHFSACDYVWPMGRYAIQIRPSDSLEHITRHVGHEMCHRVMWKQKGLHKEVWASEILAFLAGQWFLRERSFGEQAEALELRLIDFEDRVPIPLLRKSVRKSGIVANLRRDFYPPDFSQHIYRLATALVYIVGRKGMAQMVGARDLSDWIDNLSTPQDVLVRCTLGELDFGALPENAYYLNQYGYVCLLLGDKEGAVQSYLKALELCPTDANIRTWLEYALVRVSEKQKEKVHE